MATIKGNWALKNIVNKLSRWNVECQIEAAAWSAFLEKSEQKQQQFGESNLQTFSWFRFFVVFVRITFNKRLLSGFSKEYIIDCP